MRNDREFVRCNGPNPRQEKEKGEMGIHPLPQKQKKHTVFRPMKSHIELYQMSQNGFGRSSLNGDGKYPNVGSKGGGA